MRTAVASAIAASAFAAGACSLITDLNGLAGGQPTHEVVNDIDAAADAAIDAAAADAPQNQEEATDAGGAEAGPSDAGERYRAAVLEDNPLGYWRLGETSGDEAKDELMTHPGRYEGAVERGLPGAIVGSSDTAAAFDQGTVRIGDYFDFPGKSTFTLEAWIRYNHPFPTTGSNEQYFIAKMNTSGGYHAYLDSSTRLTLDRSIPTNFDSVQMDFTPSEGFHHVVFSFNGTSSAVFFDGAPLNSKPSSLSIPDTDAIFTIGGEPNTSGNFQGAIDEVAIYDHALPADRVRLHFNIGSGR